MNDKLASAEEIIFIPADLNMLKKYKAVFADIILPDDEFTGIIVKKKATDEFIGLGYLDTGYQHNIYIDEKFKGCGYGTLIMNRLMHDFKGNFEAIPQADSSTLDLLNKVGYEQKALKDETSYQAVAMREAKKEINLEKNEYYHISKSDHLAPRIGIEGLNVCKDLDILQDRKKTYKEDKYTIYKIITKDNLVPVIFDKDLMYWDAKNLAIALISKYMKKDVPGFEKEITPETIHISGLTKTDISILTPIAQLPNGKASEADLAVVIDILKSHGYDYIQYLNEGEGNGKELSYIFYPDDILDCKKVSSKILTEEHRSVQLSKSQNAGEYKDKTHGKNRFERKRYSKIASAVKAYNQIDMNEFFKRDTLLVNIPVTGETDNYTVTIKIEGVLAEIRKNIKSNQNKLEFRTIIQALTKMFNTTDVYTKCTCKDFEMRFKHWNIVNNISVDDSSQDPGPGKGIANPNDDKGRGCKHILLVLSNGDWMMKVAAVIKNYILYTEEHMQKAFTKVIFPKLYDCTIEEAQEKELIPEDIKLESEKHIIEVINDWAKNRGKFKKGSNVNPVQADKLEKEQKSNKEETK